MATSPDSWCSKHILLFIWQISLDKLRMVIYHTYGAISGGLRIYLTALLRKNVVS